MLRIELIEKNYNNGINLYDKIIYSIPKESIKEIKEQLNYWYDIFKENIKKGKYYIKIKNNF